MQQEIFTVCHKIFFDRLAEVNKAGKTSNSHSSAYVDTVEGELHSKSKHLAKQASQKNGLPRQFANWLAMTQ